MKIIAIGDIHGRSCWKEIVAEHMDAHKIVFVGDYFDSFDISVAEQLYNFKEIIQLKKDHPSKIVLLKGNHDIQYMPKSFDPYIEGFNMEHMSEIQNLLVENHQYLQMCFQFDKYLFTHAGVSETFLKDTYYPGDNYLEGIPQHLNSLSKVSPESFKFKSGMDKYGNSPQQSCVWIRPAALMAFNKKMKKSGIIQVVGHTQQNQIDIKGKATGKRYFFIDTLGTSGEYLVIENNIATSQKIKINES
jgi:hypothetical protein